jgi:hypothetical protein
MNFNLTNATAVATTGGVVCAGEAGTVAAGAAVEDTMSSENDFD